MELTPAKLLRLLLPSLCIFYCLSKASLTPHRFHEAYGDGDNYLDIFFDQNPRGYFLRGDEVRVPFRAELAGLRSSQTTAGYFYRRGTRETYEFPVAEGKFSGFLERGPGNCSAKLVYRVEKNRRTLSSGSLRAGYCPPE